VAELMYSGTSQIAPLKIVRLAFRDTGNGWQVAGGAVAIALELAKGQGPCSLTTAANKRNMMAIILMHRFPI
jgi:hypothetical protein